ncbi:MAG TPA: hypothetical protein VF933_39660 [Streptosporangiaceae bacterium]
MQLARQHVVDTLRSAGFPEVADEVLRALPDPVDIDHLGRFVEQYGITKDDLVDRMGGSP